MGVPKFYKSLKKRKYSGVNLGKLPDTIDVLAFDLNSLLHKAAQICWSYGGYVSQERIDYLETKPKKSVLENEFHQILGRELTGIISYMKPTLAVIFCIDGVAPMGKIIQQRQRRYRAALNGGASPIFDSNSITPGTDLMQGVEEYMKEWIKSRSDILPARTIFSGWKVPGEGEQKMFPLFDYTTIVDEIENDDANIVIYGMDADIIILSLFHANYTNIFIVREKISDTINIKSLRTELARDLVGRELRNFEELQQIMRDFTLITFLMGNDFLPAGPMFKDVEIAVPTLIEVYRNTNLYLTIPACESGFVDINWDNFLVFLINLRKLEPGIIEDLSKKKYNYPSEIYQRANQEGTFNEDTFRILWYNQEFALHGGEKDKSLLEKLTVLAGSDIETAFGLNIEKIEKMNKHYLITLLWNINYYLGNMRYNIGWYYGYHRVPMIGDLISTVESIKDIQAFVNENAVTPKHFFLHPLQQLLCVLPPHSRQLLPSILKPLMDTKSPLIDLYPSNVLLERFGYDQEYEGFLMLPFFDPSRVLSATSGLIEIQNMKYSQSPTYAFDKDLDQQMRSSEISEYYQRLRKLKAERRKPPRDEKLTQRKFTHKKEEGSLKPEKPGQYLKLKFEGSAGRGRGQSSFAPRGGRGRGSEGGGRGRGSEGGGRGRGAEGGRGRGAEGGSRGQSSFVPRGRGRGSEQGARSSEGGGRGRVQTSEQEKALKELIESMKF